MSVRGLGKAVVTLLVLGTLASPVSCALLKSKSRKDLKYIFTHIPPTSIVDVSLTQPYAKASIYHYQEPHGGCTYELTYFHGNSPYLKKTEFPPEECHLAISCPDSGEKVYWDLYCDGRVDGGTLVEDGPVIWWWQHILTKEGLQYIQGSYESGLKKLREGLETLKKQ